jgi:hypothetical protein
MGRSGSEVPTAFARYLLRRVEEGTRRLAATIIHRHDIPVEDIEPAQSDIAEITSVFNEFKEHVAAGERIGAIPGE